MKFGTNVGGGMPHIRTRYHQYLTCHSSRREKSVENGDTKWNQAPGLYCIADEFHIHLNSEIHQNSTLAANFLKLSGLVTSTVGYKKPKTAKISKLAVQTYKNQKTAWKLDLPFSRNEFVMAAQYPISASRSPASFEILAASFELVWIF